MYTTPKTLVPGTKCVSAPIVNKVRKIRVYDSQSGEYSVNSCGFLRSDFAELNSREDAYRYAAALSRMQELDAQSNLPENCTLEDAVRIIRPRWCQSPAEMDRFEQYCIDNALDLYKRLKEKTDEDVAAAVAAAQTKQNEQVYSTAVSAE